jgi:hypothetical protein
VQRVKARLDREGVPGTAITRVRAAEVAVALEELSAVCLAVLDSVEERLGKLGQDAPAGLSAVVDDLSMTLAEGLSALREETRDAIKLARLVSMGGTLPPPSEAPDEGPHL